FDDTFTLDPYTSGPNNQGVIVHVNTGKPNAGTVTGDGFIHTVNLEGGPGQDTFTVNDLGAGSPVQEVGVNLGSALDADNANDAAIVNDAPGANTITIQTDKIFVTAARKQAGVMEVQTRPGYTVHVAVRTILETHEADNLTVNAQGTGNTINVRSNTG